MKQRLFAIFLVVSLGLMSGCGDNRGEAVKPNEYAPMPKGNPTGVGTDGKGGVTAPAIPPK